jgi:hypothetical protein
MPAVSLDPNQLVLLPESGSVDGSHPLLAKIPRTINVEKRKAAVAPINFVRVLAGWEYGEYMGVSPLNLKI